MTREEWLLWRKKGIGGSDAPVIMGVSPYRTLLQLWEEKLSEEIDASEPDYIQQRGHEFEAKLRAYWEFKTERTWSAHLIQNAEFPWLLVSLDGHSKIIVDSEQQTEICEMKMLGLDDWTALKVKGTIPPQYVPQVQHELMVSQAKRCYFLGYLYKKDEKRDAPIDPERLLIQTVHPDHSYIETLFAREAEFWTVNIEKKVPPVPSDRDYKQLKVKGASSLGRKYMELKKKIDDLSEKQKKIKDELCTLATEIGHPRLLAGPVKLTLIARQGNVDYSKIPELKEVDLEQYRKAGSTYWKLDDAE